MEVSIIIPVYNEEDSIRKVIEEIQREVSLNKEIIVVDDGSEDSTPEKIPSSVKVFRFKENRGKSAALMKGFNIAKNDLLITMDGDGQNDPKDIKRMVTLAREGNFDLVTGWRKKRASSKLKEKNSQLGFLIRKVVINDQTKDSVCALKVIRKEMAEKIKLPKGMHRFIPALVNLKGGRVKEVKVNDRPRKGGESKYNLTKNFHALIDLLTIFLLQNRGEKYIHREMWILIAIIALLALLPLLYVLVNSIVFLLIGLLAATLFALILVVILNYNRYVTDN